MGMIGDIIGGVGAIGGAIFGGISAARKAKEKKQIIQAEKADNENWYDRRYNEDYTKRADAQRILAATQQQLLDADRRAAAMQAVGGASTEDVAAQKAAAVNAVGQAAANMGVQSEARKDSIESQYQAKHDAITQQQLNQIEGERQAIGQATTAVSSAFGKLGSSLKI